jgi:hypothetical protein
MAINSATYSGPSGSQTITLTITPQNATDMAFVVQSLNLNGPTPNNLILNITSTDAASGGNTVYHGSFPDGGDNAYVDLVFFVYSSAYSTIAGTFICVASTTTTLTLNNPNGTATADLTGVTATNGWIELGGSTNIWMQQLNSLDPVSFVLTLDASYPWAAIIATVPIVGAVGTVTYQFNPGYDATADLTFDNGGNPVTSAPEFSVSAGDTIIGFCPAGWGGVELSEPLVPMADISDTLGNVYQQVYAACDISEFASAYLFAAFNSPAGASDAITATIENVNPDSGPTAYIFVFSGLKPVAPSSTVTGTYFYPDGTPVANGSYSVKLSEDATLVTGGQISAGVVATGILDPMGGLEGLALYSTDPSIMKSFSGNDLFYEFTVMNPLGITVWHSEFQLPAESTFFYDMSAFTPPTSYCYNDPGLMFVTDPPQVEITISPKTVTLNESATQQFTYTLTINGVASTNVTWSATGGTITSGGLYTAGGAIGTYAVTVASADFPAYTASAVVTIQLG